MTKQNLTTNSNDLLTRYMRLMDISKDIASTLDLDVLLTAIVNAAVDVTNSEAASILLYDEAKEELFFHTSTDMDDPKMGGVIVPVDASIAGTIILTRKPIIVDNTKDDPRHYKEIENVLELKTQSLLGAPLIANDKIVGVLEAINKIDGKFTLEDQELLTALGAQAAVAIENARMFQQSDLIAEMIHELRTPLASISTASNLITRPEISQEQRAAIAETIQRDTLRLSEMASSFLDLARLESGRSNFTFEPINLIKVLEESSQIMNSRIESQGLSLIMDIPDALPTVNGDPNKLKQVILNLISNAIKYNRPGGSITVSASSEDNNIFLCVKDSGRG
ncbi:MAG: GAF domain-containing protein, partial [Chloroflexota bacterium]